MVLWIECIFSWVTDHDIGQAAMNKSRLGLVKPLIAKDIFRIEECYRGINALQIFKIVKMFEFEILSLKLAVIQRILNTVLKCFFTVSILYEDKIYLYSKIKN